MNIDQDFGLRNADWINTVAWDLPRTVEPFLAAIGGPDKLAHFLTLPAAEAMPSELRLALDIRELEKSLKYSEDQARDDHGRWTSGGGGGGEALTTGPSPSPVTPENFREHWKPEMTPAEGHAWAEAAGTKYPATVVHMTSMPNMEGIEGTGFHTDTAYANHEAGAYFATDPDTAEFYEYKGDAAISAVVVLQDPLVLNWTDPENLSEAAQSGEFRRAALEAAGYDPGSIVAAMPDLDIYAAEGQTAQEMLDNPQENGYERWEVESMIWGNVDNPKDSTELLRMKDYDGVIIKPLWDADQDPSTGGSQLIVFDKEQAVVIGTEQLPEIDFDRPFVETAPSEFERVQESGVDESRTAVIERAFQKREYVRDERGRFAETEGGDGGLPDTHHGMSPAGVAAGQDLFEGTVDEYASYATNADASALKEANVKEIGAALVAASESDPALHQQLTVMGARVEDSQLLDQDFKDRYLHLEPGMNWTEIGAAYAANAFQMTWMQSATDNSTTSLALQQAIADKFGIDTSEMTLFSTVDSNLGDRFFNQQTIDAFGLHTGNVQATDEQGKVVDALAASPMLQAYVETVYERTQQELKDKGITEISLFRGMGNVGTGSIHNDTVLLNPVSSFSTFDEIARQFAEGSMGYGAGVLEMTVPAERIFATPMTGPGCLKETEVLVIGGPVETRVIPLSRGTGY